MKVPSKFNEPVNTDILAEGICACYDNAERLTEEAEILINAGKFLGAFNSLCLAEEELIKTHLLTQGVTYENKEKDKWKWLWKSFYDHREKIRILEYEFHWSSYEDKAEFERRVNLAREQRENATYVNFDYKQKRFILPEESLGGASEVERLARNELRYVYNLFKIFYIGGKPTLNIEKTALKSIWNEQKKNPRKTK
jgi:AbiV family abortive infection protein